MTRYLLALCLIGCSDRITWDEETFPMGGQGGEGGEEIRDEDSKGGEGGAIKHEPASTGGESSGGSSSGSGGVLTSTGGTASSGGQESSGGSSPIIEPPYNPTCATFRCGTLTLVGEASQVYCLDVLPNQSSAGNFEGAGCTVTLDGAEWSGFSSGVPAGRLMVWGCDFWFNCYEE